MTTDPHRRGDTPRAKSVLRACATLTLTALAAAFTVPASGQSSGALEFFRQDVASRQPVEPTRSGIVDRLFGAEPQLREAAPVTRRPSTRNASPAGRRTICVRTCDGYWFPVGSLAATRDLPVHDLACNTACPGAPTTLFVADGGDITHAKAADGTLYRDLPTAHAYQAAVDPTCSCQGPNRRVADRLDVRRDPTLRRGDIVVTTSGPLVYEGSVGLPRELADFSPLQEAGIASSRRDHADARLGVSFRETLVQRFREARGPARTQLAREAVAERTASAALRTVRRVDLIDVSVTGAIGP